MAEREGFEPPIRFPVYTLSKRAPSATRPSLRFFNSLLQLRPIGDNTLMDFASFLREKQYLQNVSPNTLRWYGHALKWLPTENPDELALKDMVIRPTWRRSAFHYRQRHTVGADRSFTIDQTPLSNAWFRTAGSNPARDATHIRA